MLSATLRSAAVWALLGSGIVPVQAAIELNIDDTSSIKNAAHQAATQMLSFYHGEDPGKILGLIDLPYYWWEGGAMFGHLINYWNLTGDGQFNDLVKRGILFQIGENNDFEPKNRTQELGNDDQQFWAFTAMDAAEARFPDPPSDKPGWLALAQAVFNRQIARWETAECGGGLRWQTVFTNQGWDYKNTPSNGGLFHLAARLARYTGNQTYADWAIKTWDWEWDVGFIAPRDGDANSYSVFDGGHIDSNCTKITQIMWTYNYGTLLVGSAYMYNHTNGDAMWKERLDKLLNGTKIMFVGPSSGDKAPDLYSGNIVTEIACELQTPQTCNRDNPAFKSFLLRWLAVTTQIAPYTKDIIMPYIRDSAKAAAPLCQSPGYNGSVTFCNRRWYQTAPDGNTGMGEQMSALSAFQNLLIPSAPAPVTANTGGTSQGNPSAGTGSGNSFVVHDDITAGDKAGASIVTILVLGAQVYGAYWMVFAKD